MMTQDYINLLTTVQPKPIHTEQEKQKMLKQVDQLMAIDENELTLEQENLLELLAILIEDYESRTVQMPQKASPNEILIELMESNDLKQKDLLDIFGSKGIISEVVNQKRSISKSQAKALGERFNVSPALFI
ncbi:transcriptional regulator [Crocosphaera sp. UHCC 0190]|uniref:helix-turn-helix domain-containing protein n=1 Tax=Crocosphaera sp. UHCC 0190 TaxID=3110246 RepID=UPI002B1FC57A|nr:transcriptional regulator [Crocosphaera sp. UHCC 0190]MEA5508969.1 transcriptional regulator [Crocosphaera sp. UHCC 0190]